MLEKIPGLKKSLLFKNEVYNLKNMDQTPKKTNSTKKTDSSKLGASSTGLSENAKRFSKLVAEIKWLASLGICLGLFLILATYSKDDPAWFVDRGGAVTNIGGKVGAYLADLLLGVFGVSAYWWVVLFGRRIYHGWKEIAQPEWLLARQEQVDVLRDSILVRWLGFVLTIGSSMALESIRFHSLSMKLPAQPGGVLGDIIGRFVELTFLRIRYRRESVEDRKIGEQAAVEREEIVEEELEKFDIAPTIQIVRQPLTVLTSDRVEREKQQPLFADLVDSELPPISLLDAPRPIIDTISADTLEFTSRLIERKLKDFGVDVTVIAAYPGPVITRYEIEPAVGVKGSQIVNLSKDLNRALGTQALRVVETIPGKTCMGLEVPNPTRQTISLSEILGSHIYNSSSSLLTLALGKDIAGTPMVSDLAKMPHCLVAGTTGSGKSVGINAMILSMLFKAKPDEVRLILIDPKMLEMAMYEDIPHLLCPVVTDMRQASNALNWAVKEMDRRYKLMSKFGVRNLTGFNKKIADAEEKGEHLYNPFSLTPEDPEPLYKAPTIVIVIDELADLMMVVGKKLEELIARIAQKARAAGIHLVLATQRPSVDVITGLIKANVPTRISFQVSSRIDSRTILDQQGAESLLGMGDMLYMAPGTGLPSRVHGAFVSDDEVQRVVDWLKERTPANYIEGILEGGTEDGSGDGEGANAGGEADPLYDQAVAIVLENKRASISLVQRHLRIGYNRAARLLEDMERAGLVSKMSGSGSREILVPGGTR